jgi:hypothetical protein
MQYAQKGDLHAVRHRTKLDPQEEENKAAVFLRKLTMADYSSTA